MIEKFDFLVDFDTPIVSAAAVCQSNRLITTHIKSGRVKEWESKTEFNNFLKQSEGRWTKEDFICEVKVYTVGSYRQQVDALIRQMKNIQELPFVNSAKFVIGGDKGNFRKDIARILPYKGTRPEKPIYFEKVKSTLLREAKDMIIQPQGAWESDDELSMFMYVDHDFPRAISFIDKDLKTVVGWSNSFKTNQYPIYTNEFEAFKNLAYQSLVGDKSDNVAGIQHQVDSVIGRFRLKKSSKGFGDASAKGCLQGARSIEDIVERVCFVYHETYKDGLILEDGTKLSWIEVMDENFKLLKMLDYPDQDYCFSKLFNVS